MLNYNKRQDQTIKYRPKRTYLTLLDTDFEGDLDIDLRL